MQTLNDISEFYLSNLRIKFVASTKRLNEIGGNYSFEHIRLINNSKAILEIRLINQCTFFRKILFY